MVPLFDNSGDRGGSFSCCRLSRGGGGGGRMGVQLVSSLVLRLELVCHRRQATIGQQGQAASQKITKPQIHLDISYQITNTFSIQIMCIEVLCPDVSTF